MDSMLHVRFTRVEIEDIRRAAKAAGMGVSAWARAVLLRAAATEVRLGEK